MMDELYLSIQQEAGRMGKSGSVHIKKYIPESFGDIDIMTDEVRLKQVMTNLINNALKFTDQGEIKFGYDVDLGKGLIRFFVSDTGIGISSENQKNIFDRFKQTPEGAKSFYKGTGLGLAISKGIVEILGGSVGLSSGEDLGTEFYFNLPLEPPKLTDAFNTIF